MRVLLDLVGYVLLAVGLTGLVGMVVPGGLVWGGVALLAGSAVPGWLFLARDGRPPAALGMPLDGGAPGEALKGWMLGVALAAAVVGAMALAGGVRWVPDEGSVGAFVGGGGVLLATLAVPALAEEVALRGYLLQAAVRGFGPLTAVLGTSVLFGLLHLGNPEVGWQGIVGIIAAGVMLGALVLRTRALWWSAGAHLGWNWLLAWPADLPVSGLELADTPGWDARLTGPPWLSGGVFGPEASVLAAAALLAAAVMIWKGSWPRPLEGRPAPLYDDDVFDTNEEDA